MTYKNMSLKNALKNLGCTDITLKWNGGIASRDLSGFFTGGGKVFEQGQTYYITWSDFSYCGKHVMYRKAEDRRDFSGKGGFNQWDFEDTLLRMGIKLKQNVVMPKWG